MEPFKSNDLDSVKFCIIERHVCILYDRTANITSVNKLREAKKKNFRNYHQHKFLSSSIQEDLIYQASIGLNCMKSNIDPPDPSYYGWNQHECRVVLHWTDLPPISAECSALLKCGCKNMPFCLKNC